MRKSIKWTLIGIGIFIGVSLILTVTFFIGATILGIKGFISEYEPVEVNLKLGQAIKYDGLMVSIMDYKFTDSYKDYYMKLNKPQEGAKYFWIYVKAENIGNDELDLPGDYWFHVYYKDSELSLISYMFEGIHMENTYISKSVYPSYGAEGWLIYEVYEKAEQKDMKVYYSYSKDKTPVNCIWKLEK
ncbi:MAG: hypothetical protein M1308_02195 [Actinobacteria bacterium]|nr:hypothetical protein [Actinomycetota bacterium]